MLDLKLTPELESEGSDDAAVSFYDLIIIGGGPAGLTAAIYSSRARINTLLLTGVLPGGQPMNTDIVENYPGFPEGIAGPELGQHFQAQAGRFGAQIKTETVNEVDFGQQPFAVKTHKGTYQSRAVIIASGAEPRRMGVPGEDKFYGRGVSACATCDGFFYREKEVIVVGGGDSAIAEAIFLTRFADKVTVIHRRDELRATKIYQEQAFANPKIDFVWDTVVEEVLGDQTVSGVRVCNVKNDETSIIKADGVFVYIGMVPQTTMFADQIELDESGYVISDQQRRTSVPGVFVAGDVQDPRYRQLVIAAGSGAAAAIEAEKYLSGHE
jgi:thioredoxin reductase (NADPH)